MASISYTDGVLTIRRLGPADLEQHLSAVDDAQMDWLWDPGDRQKNEARSPEEQRAGQLACHPGYRGRGLTSRAVRLACSFLREHTDVTEAHLVIHQDNEPSLRVARAVGATEVERYVDEHGRPMVRHILTL